jgi:NitT/TauT family transport system ATP-binding protein
MAFVDLKAVSLTYRMGKETTLALADATFSIDKGEFIAVVGPSGCGKSTIMKLVTGLLPASSGEVRVAGAKVTGPIKGVGMAFQNPTLMPWRTTMDNILLPMEVVEPHKRRFRSNRADYEARAMKLLHTVGLADFASKFPWQLSGGMQQRSNLCRALIHEPELLMLDEPFGALDAFTREEMNHLVEEIWLDTRTTIVLITHSIEEAIFLSDRIVVMSPRPGRVASIHEVPFARPRSLEIMSTREVFDLTNAIKMEIVGEQQSRYAKPSAAFAQPAN